MFRSFIEFMVNRKEKSFIEFGVNLKVEVKCKFFIEFLVSTFRYPIRHAPKRCIYIYYLQLGIFLHYYLFPSGLLATVHTYFPFKVFSISKISDKVPRPIRQTGKSEYFSKSSNIFLFSIDTNET